MLTSTRCSPPAPNAWSTASASAVGITPRPATRRVDPVADVRRAERPPHDVAQVEVADQPSAVVAQADRERHALAAPRGPLHVAVDVAVGARRVQLGPAARAATTPRAPASPGWRRRTSDQAAGVAAAVRPQQHGPVRQDGRPSGRGPRASSPPVEQQHVHGGPGRRRGDPLAEHQQAVGLGEAGESVRPTGAAAAPCTPRRAARRRGRAGTRAGRRATRRSPAGAPCTLGRNTGSAPASSWITGRASTSKPISAAPGSPGRQTTGTSSPPTVPKPSVVPGQSATSVNCDDAPVAVAAGTAPGAACRPGPVPVPPVVMIRSARSVWSSSSPRRPSGSSSQMPDPVRERARLHRGGGQRVRVGVDHLAGLAGPADVDQLVAGGHHDHPRAGPDHHVPDAGGGERPPPGPASTYGAGAARAPAPAGSSSPARRTPDPRLGACKISTAAMPWSVQCTGTTTSAPIGSGAPAATEKQVPGVSRTGRQLAAPRSPTTLSRTGRGPPSNAERRVRADAPGGGEVLPARRVPVDRGLVEGRERVRGDARPRRARCRAPG